MLKASWTLVSALVVGADGAKFLDIVVHCGLPEVSLNEQAQMVSTRMTAYLRLIGVDPFYDLDLYHLRNKQRPHRTSTWVRLRPLSLLDAFLNGLC